METSTQPQPPQKPTTEMLGRFLIDWREKSRLTAAQVADRLGTSRAQLYRWESGNIVRLDAAERIASLVGLKLTFTIKVNDRP